MRFLKLFFLKEEEDIRLLSYKALSLGASIKKDKFESYIGQHIDSFVKLVLKTKEFKKTKLLSETCIIEVFGEVKDMRKHKLEKPSIEINLLENLSEEQKIVAGFPRVVERAFLKEIGIKSTDFYQNWGRIDDRQAEWQKDQKKYGFDERATWCLDDEIKRFIYERIVFFQRYAPKEPEEFASKLVFKKKEYTFEEYLDEIIDGLRLDLTLDEFSLVREEKATKAKIGNALPMLLTHIECLWW